MTEITPDGTKVPLRAHATNVLSRLIIQVSENFTDFKDISTRRRKKFDQTLSYWPAGVGSDLIVAFLLILFFAFVVLDPLIVPVIRMWPSNVVHMFHWITELGAAKLYLVPVVILTQFLLFCSWQKTVQRVRYSIFTLSVWLTTAIVALGAGGLLVNLTKRTIGRARPMHFDEMTSFAFVPFNFSNQYASFPSGHAATAGSAFVLAVIFFPKWRVSLFVLAIIAAFSRVIINVHYVSDVIIGPVVGALLSWMVCVYFARRGVGFKVDSTKPSGLAPKPLPLPAGQIVKEIGGAFRSSFKQ